MASFVLFWGVFSTLIFGAIKSEQVVIVCSFFTIQVCDDIDECKGPDNGGCTANSICHNSVVRTPLTYCMTITTGLYCYSKMLMCSCHNSRTGLLSLW